MSLSGFYCCHYLVSGFFIREFETKSQILRYYFLLLEFTFLTYFCVMSFACGGLEMTVTTLYFIACLLRLRPDYFRLTIEEVLFFHDIPLWDNNDL